MKLVLKITAFLCMVIVIADNKVIAQERSMGHEPRLYYAKSSTTEVWIERMLFEGNGCQIIKKNVHDDVPFVINYIFDGNEKHFIQSLVLTPSSSHLLIICKNSIVLLRLSRKSYSAMVSKKARKGLDVQWGIVKDSKVYMYPTVILSVSFDAARDLNIYLENGTITTLNFMKEQV